MPTPMKATTKVYDALGTLVAESSHPSFDLAWSQAARDLFATWRIAQERAGFPAILEELKKAFSRAWKDYRGALRGASGEFVIPARGEGLYLRKYVITEYSPVSSIEPTEYFTPHQAAPDRVMLKISA